VVECLILTIQRHAVSCRRSVTDELLIILYFVTCYLNVTSFSERNVFHRVLHGWFIIAVRVVWF